jgi:hypothetical protein
VSHALETPDEDVQAAAEGRAAVGAALAGREEAVRRTLHDVQAELGRARRELEQAASARDHAERRFQDPERRFQALRGRKVVRIGLKATALVPRVRQR